MLKWSTSDDPYQSDSDCEEQEQRSYKVHSKSPLLSCPQQTFINVTATRAPFTQGLPNLCRPPQRCSTGGRPVGGGNVLGALFRHVITAGNICRTMTIMMASSKVLQLTVNLV